MTYTPLTTLQPFAPVRPRFRRSVVIRIIALVLAETLRRIIA